MKKKVEAFIAKIYSKRYTRSEKYFKGAMEYALWKNDITYDEYIEISKMMCFSPAIIAKGILILEEEIL